MATMPDYTIDIRHIRQALTDVRSRVLPLAGAEPRTIADILGSDPGVDVPAILPERDWRLILWALEATGHSAYVPIYSGDIRRSLESPSLE